MNDHSWLQLTYKVPAEPGRKRLSIWRKIKALGALYLQNGVCVIPKTEEHERRLRIIENEINEMGGEAVLLKASGLDKSQEERIIARFNAEQNETYAEFLERCDGLVAEIERESAAGKYTYAELEENDEDLQKLRTWLSKIRTHDFYNAPLGAEADDRLARCAALLDEFAQKVFDAQAEYRVSRSARPSDGPISMNDRLGVKVKSKN